MNSIRLILLSFLLTSCTADEPLGPEAPPSSDRGKADDSTEPAATGGALSHVGRAALASLEAFPKERGSTWSLRTDAGFDTGWVLQTPVDHWGDDVRALSVPRCASGCDPDFGLQRCTTNDDCTDGGHCAPVQSTVARPGDAPRSLCVGHSDRFYDELYLAVIEAESQVDILTLSPADGRFEAALRNAITYLAGKERPIRIRILTGNIITQETDTEAVLARLTRDLPRDNLLTIHVGGYRKGFDSWNHAKIIAVDGQLLVQGGHNLWDLHYLDKAPIHDLSMSVRGAVAADAHQFANRLWSYTCKDPWIWFGYNSRAAYPPGSSDCPAPLDARARETEPGAPTFVLGRLGALGANPADDAILASLRAARQSIKISQQDIGPVLVGWFAISDWPEPILGELARAVMRGVEVDIALSAPRSLPGDLSFGSAQYGNGWTAEDVLRRIRDWLEDHPEAVPAGTDVRAELCSRLRVTTLRVNDRDDLWRDGERIGNHAKMFIVDDVAFYIGSQNFYPANLAELGLLVDDPVATAALIASYWEPLWRYSARAAVSGRDDGRCAL